MRLRITGDRAKKVGLLVCPCDERFGIDFGAQNAEAAWFLVFNGSSETHTLDLPDLGSWYPFSKSSGWY